MASDMVMVAGDSHTIEILIADAEGTPVDVSNAQAIRYGLFNGSTAALVSKSLSSGITVDTSTVTVTLEPEDTAGLRGAFVHELEITDVTGAVHTPLQGRVTIMRDYLT